jgi:hypothetical protein
MVSVQGDLPVAEVADSPGEADASNHPSPEPPEPASRGKLVELRNLTNRRLVIRPDNGPLLVIPPLDVLPVAKEVLKNDVLCRAQDARIVGWQTNEERALSLDDVFKWAAWGLLITFIGVVGLTGSDTKDTSFSLAVLAVGAVCLCIATGMAIAYVGRLGNVFSGVQRALGRLREMLFFAAATLIVLAFPAAFLYFGANVSRLYREAVEDPGVNAQAVRLHEAAAEKLVDLAIQGLCIVGASVLPIVLYFVFDKVKLRTLRERFNREVFRLDPGVLTLADVQAKYGQVIDEVYGRRSDNRLLPGARSPILLAAAVITVGWSVALLDTLVQHRTDVFGSAPLTTLLAPTPSAATYAFLGSYFYALNAVLRGYVRGDLRPKTYAEVAGRIVGVVVLAFVLERLTGALGGEAGSAPLLVLAFMAGIVPDTVLVRLQETVQRVFGRSRVLARLAKTYESQPLTDIEGIDIYDRARLGSEGVTNVEGLAHHDLVDLLLRTRIPATRLVDWVDQAILRLHCEFEREGDRGAGHTHADSLYERLRRHGIRTATDLEMAYAGALDRNEGDVFLQIGDGAGGAAHPLRVLLDALVDDEWMPNLRFWRLPCHQDPPAELGLPEAFANDPTLAGMLATANLGPPWKRDAPAVCP